MLDMLRAVRTLREFSEEFTAYLEKYPALELIYRFTRRLCYLLLKKHRTHRQYEILIPGFHNFEHYGLRVKVLCG